MNFLTNKWVHVAVVVAAVAVPTVCAALGVPVPDLVTALIAAAAGGSGATAMYQHSEGK